ncbi:PREDICTED: vitellin-degrading protease-like [Dinoponera quadriceps]|uniref:Vitellin-degrading protease-like n=1 Tax=Dinoponera quadriceps TaxID=609295 RepID=A0A6P3YDV5_DINQU|nr:PREDICTED: vitellin-degrading protease-like [Dinoponera quadriceps]
MNIHFFTLALLHFAVAHLCQGLPINSVKKILGGSDVNIKFIPYMLSVMLNGEYICCAAIIDKHYAVTAAHCVRAAKHPTKEISVRSGSSFLHKGGTIHEVTRAFVHKDYNNITNDYDIAVIKITPPFDNSTKPVYLVQNDAEDTYTKWGLVCGWGYYIKINDYIYPALTEVPHCVMIPQIQKEQCYKDYKLRYELTSRMTCYGFQEGMDDTCKGDSGAALINKDNILLGVTSWGDGCGEPYSPGVYTDAIFLQNWIRGKIEKCT